MLLRERGQSGSWSSGVLENAGTCAEKVPGPGGRWSSGVGPGWADTGGRWVEGSPWSGVAGGAGDLSAPSILDVLCSHLSLALAASWWSWVWWTFGPLDWPGMAIWASTSADSLLTSGKESSQQRDELSHPVARCGEGITFKQLTSWSTAKLNTDVYKLLQVGWGLYSACQAVHWGKTHLLFDTVNYLQPIRTTAQDTCILH